MYEIILVIHVVIAAALIIMVLLQQGKGGMGALGGGGGSQTLFGSQGSSNFFTRVTALLATGFFITSLTLSGIAVQRSKAARDAAMPIAPVVQQQQEMSTEPAEQSADDVPVIPQ